MTESDLADLGVFRIAIPIPFAAAGGPVNAYLVDEADGGLLMWDAGLGSPKAQAALEEGFERLGRRFDEVTRIVVSHGHVDHFGAARFVLERSGRNVPVYAHEADAPKMAEGGWRWRDRQPHFAAYLARLGVPQDVLLAIAREGERSFGLSRRLAEVRPMGEGVAIRTRHLALRVLHMPGHTPGLICLYEPERRILFSGDHLLERISPNPIIEPGPGGEEGFFRPLISYLASVRRTRALDIDLVLPGHGAPFSGHGAVIDRLLDFFGKRQARIVELLGEGPATAYELSRALFPAAVPAEAFLTVSETIANLEVLEAEGRVSRAEEGGRYRFRAAAR